MKGDGLTREEQVEILKVSRARKQKQIEKLIQEIEQIDQVIETFVKDIS